MNLHTNAGDDVELWLAPLASAYDAAQLAEYEMLLDAGERARWQRYRFPEDRQRFLIGRAFVRRVLAMALGRNDPAALQFTVTPHGKPELAGADTGRLHFNLSHTNAMLVLATSRTHALGIDVEAVTRKVELLPLAQRYFAPAEYDELLHLDSGAQRERFFALWTLKEAWLKACGLGLRVPLDSFRFDLSGTQPTIAFDHRHDDSPGRWQFHLLAREQFRIALAVACDNTSPMNILTHDWDN